MTNEQKILSERLVLCPGFRWMPGMLAVFRSKDATGSPCERRIRIDTATAATVRHPERHHRYLPDLEDPATIGCVIFLVCQIGPAEVRSMIESLERSGKIKGFYPKKAIS